MRITMLTSLPVGGPDGVPVTDPPGALLISGASGIEITVKAAEGTVIGVPYYWQDGVWQPLLGDATVAPRQVKAIAAGVDIGHLAFNKPATPLWFAVLETGGGTVSFCDIREADGTATLGLQEVSSAGGGGGGGDATAANQVIGNASLASIEGKLTAPLSVTGPLTDVQLRASAVPVSGPLTDIQLRATPVPVSGTVTANIGTSGSLATEATLAGVATSVKQSDGTQRTKITDGTNNVAVTNSAPVGTEYGLLVRQVGTSPVLSAITTATKGYHTAIDAMTSVTLLVANSSAKGRIFYNAGSVVVYISYGSGTHTGQATASFELAAGATYVMQIRSDGSMEWPGEVRAIVGGSTNGSLVTTEIT